MKTKRKRTNVCNLGYLCTCVALRGAKYRCVPLRRRGGQISLCTYGAGGRNIVVYLSGASGSLPLGLAICQRHGSSHGSNFFTLLRNRAKTSTRPLSSLRDWNPKANAVGELIVCEKCLMCSSRLKPNEFQ